jgi:hypothetical protein
MSAPSFAIPLTMMLSPSLRPSPLPTPNPRRRDDEEEFELTDWEWEVKLSADVKARVKRLETEKFSRLELYEELIELMALLEVYWKGQAPERQQETAREVRDLLRTSEALKERMQAWARKKIARVV